MGDESVDFPVTSVVLGSACHEGSESNGWGDPVGQALSDPQESPVGSERTLGAQKKGGGMTTWT